MTPVERICDHDPHDRRPESHVELWDAWTAFWDDMSMKPFLSAEERREREDLAWRALLMANHYRRQLQAEG